MRVKANTERGTQFFVNNQLLVNASGVTSDFLNEAGTGITVDAGDGALAAGAFIVRDMGKSVRLPVATGGGSYGIRTLRKVQRITSASVTTSPALNSSRLVNSRKPQSSSLPVSLSRSGMLFMPLATRMRRRPLRIAEAVRP